jgi:hypothetical protein
MLPTDNAFYREEDEVQSTFGYSEGYWRCFLQGMNPDTGGSSVINVVTDNASYKAWSSVINHGLLMMLLRFQNENREAMRFIIELY